MSDDDFNQKLDEFGEDGIRDRLVTGKFSGRHRDLATEWLRKAEQGRSDAQRAVDVAIGQSAKNAAWAAAWAAIIAVPIALAALVKSFFFP